MLALGDEDVVQVFNLETTELTDTGAGGGKVAKEAATTKTTANHSRDHYTFVNLVTVDS